MHPVTTWLAIVGSVWALFALAEEHLLPLQRAQITRWLRCQTGQWAATFVMVCDSVFGPPALSGAYGWRAGMASYIVAFLALCLSGVFYPGTFGATLLVLFLYAPLLIASLALINMLPGYVALRVQRALLQCLSQSQRPARLGVWCLCACMATLALALLAWALGLLVVLVSSQAHVLRRPVTWLVGYVEFALRSPAGSLSALQDAALLRPVVLPGLAFPSFGIWLYAPCFPLLWVWLYILSGTLIRYATAWGLMPAAGRAPRLLDSDARPLYTLGAVAVSVVSAVYWTAVLLT
jgi:hypothetical protein